MRSRLGLGLALVATVVLVIALVAIVSSPGSRGQLFVVVLGLFFQIVAIAAWFKWATIKRLLSAIVGFVLVVLALYGTPSTLSSGFPPPEGPALLFGFEGLVVAGALMLVSALVQP